MNTSAIDIFCGIGGLSYGLKKAGIAVVAGLDIDESCKYPYEKNVQAEFIQRDVSNLRGEEINERYWSNDVLKILAGCAPCQPFSTHSNKIKDKIQIWQIRRYSLISSPFWSGVSITFRILTFIVLIMEFHKRGGDWSCLRRNMGRFLCFPKHIPKGSMLL